MTPSRTCRDVPLRNQPLVLVLGQVRFSRIQRMADYLPTIQDVFRREGYPVDRSGKIQHVTFNQFGMERQEIEHGDYRTREERWTVTVLQDSVVVQTTEYSRFEDFAKKLRHALAVVLEATEQRESGVIERVGLRYINAIEPAQGEDFRAYLQPGFHGIGAGAFKSPSARVFSESIGHTELTDGGPGTMIVRVSQNDLGFVLPPDLLGTAPRTTGQRQNGKLVTLLDMDHFMVGKFDPNPDWVIERAFELHDQLVETFHDHVATPHAFEVWA